MKRSLVILLILLSSLCNAQQLRLSLNLFKGNTYYLKGVSNSLITQTINGQDNLVNLGLSYKIAFKVINKRDSLYDVDVSYQSVIMKIKVGEKITDISSESNDGSDVPSKVISAMMNKPFSIILTQDGKVKSVKNIEEIINNVFDTFPQVDASKKAQLKSQFVQYFGGNAFIGNIETQLAIFPRNGVTKSDKWNVNTKMENMGKINSNTIYHLSGVETNFYKIDGYGTMSTEKGSKPSEINGMPVKYGITGTLRSNIKINKITGWPIEVRSLQIMNGNIEILNNSKVPGGMNIPLSLKTEATATDN